MRLRSPLATARISAGYATQQDLADEVGVPLQTVSRWECGVYAPRGENRKKLARALKMSLNCLALAVAGTGEWSQNTGAPGLEQPDHTVVPGDISDEAEGRVGLALGPPAHDRGRAADAVYNEVLSALEACGPAPSGDGHDRDQAMLFITGPRASTGARVHVDPVEDLRLELGRLVGAAGNTDSWRRIAREHAQAIDTTPPREFIAHLTADLAELCQDIEKATSDEDQVQLRRVSARLSVLMATALTDAADIAAARRWWRTARSTADAINDLRLQAWLCGRWALVCQSVEIIPQALQLADEADELAERLADGKGEGNTDAVLCPGLAEATAARALAWAARGDTQRPQASLERLTGMVARLSLAGGNGREAGAWPPNRLRSINTHVRALLAAQTAEDPSLYEELRIEVDELKPFALRQRTAAHLKWALALIGNGHLVEGADRAQTAMRCLPGGYRTAPITILADRVAAALHSHRS